MRVFHFILGKADKHRANGVNQVIAGLAKYSVRLGAEVRVIGKAETVRYEGEEVPRDSFSVKAYSRWSRALARAVWEAVEWADIVHLHGTYSPANVAVSKICEHLGRPYVVTLHDGLSPERRRIRGRVRKAVFHSLLQRRHFERAAALHVLTEEESTDVIGSLPAARIVCIPNGIDPEDFPARAPLQRGGETLTIGHLGRLSPEKNLESLCMGVDALRGEWDVRLRLAGPGTAYGEQLRSRFGDGWLELAGPVYGESKTAFMDSIDLLVIPSISEGFSVVAAEALAMRTPLLVSRTSKMSHYFDRNAFFMCEPTAFGIERGLRRALAERSSWDVITGNGRRLVDESLNWHAVASRMLAAYETVARSAA